MLMQVRATALMIFFSGNDVGTTNVSAIFSWNVPSLNA